jgi:hypothetical protein
MMDFGVVEQQIVDMLISKIPGPEIEFSAIGENDIDYVLPVSKSKVIIAFSNEEPNPASGSMDMMNQDSSVVFSVLVQSRKIRGNHGIYQVANLIKKYLTGFQPSDGDCFRYAGMRFEQKVKNTFEYSLDFKTRSKVVQQVPEEVGPRFKQVNYQE